MNVSTDKFDALVEKIERLIDRLAPDTAVSPDFDNCFAFRWEGSGETGGLIGVANPHLYDLNDLVGVDDIRDEVVRNTAQFVAGVPANNVLLWGERGCGKSSLVKGLLKPFAPGGLRIVELKRWDIMSLPRIVSQLRGVPRYFILFCDDLSFDEGEGDFRALKTLLDGDIEERPANVLIYATSNRRHLMPELTRDTRGDSEIHPEEAEGEKLALSDRFGLSFGFYRLSQDEYLSIVRHYAERRNLPLTDEELCDKALMWSLDSARRSGRSARQFIDDLEGRLRVRELNLSVDSRGTVRSPTAKKKSL
ncbi:ATP-binding protein [Geobacter sp. SVR]|uniref:ATP-binding protein n=1 Tax=Geobacter sp. SVR TaxID=2495594 RepID=UPI00143EFB2C|nr:ATP-binding protein [Geobacter sp. SVR]BCS53755.1 ATPase [Geobacter sp. SVR]GCF85736.1 ATPase [Geobacter sp. SVR]